jgi:hypothetical protein
MHSKARHGFPDTPVAIITLFTWAMRLCGSKAVTATVVHDNYKGVKTGTLVIAKANQTISFPDLPVNLLYGDADYPLTAVASSGLPVKYVSSNSGVATIVNGAIHITGPGTASITASQTGNANWNAAVAVSKTLNIGKKNQTIDFSALADHAVGDADFAPGATATSGLTVTYTSSNSAAATIVSGKIHITGAGTTTITASQAGNANWNAAATAARELTLNKGRPVITWANPAPITYGALLSATQLNAKANIPGGFAYAPAIGSKLSAGAQTLTATFTPTDTTRYDVVEKSVPLTVNKAAATVTIAALNQTYTGTPRPVTVNTLPAGLDVDTTYNGNNEPPTDIGSYAVLATVNDTDATGIKTATLVIGKGVQTIDFPELTTDLRYGDEAYPLTATAGSGLPVTYASSNPAVVTILNNTIQIAGAGTATITASQAGNANWNAARAVSRTLTIGKKTQTIDFPAFESCTLGEADFAPGATVSSGLSLTYTSSNTAAATIVNGNIHIVGRGTSVITAKQAGNTNWNVAAPVTQTLTVSAGIQIITFNNLPDKVYGEANFAPGATASSGLAVTYASSNLNVATIVSGKIHITGVGTTTVTASQVGNASWNAATPATQELTVGKGLPVVTWANPAAITYGALLTATQLNAKANILGGFAYTPVIGTKLSVGVQTLSVDFTPKDTERYTAVHKSVSLTVNKANATLAIASLNQTYTGTQRPVTVTTLPLGLDVNIAYDGSADAPVDVGSYLITATVVDDNCTGVKTGTLVIAKANQTITFPALPTNLLLNDPDYPLTATAGLPVTYASSNTAVATIENGAIHIVGTGKTNISASQTGNANWSAAPNVSKTLTVGKDNQSIDFPAFEIHALGDADFAPGAAATSGLTVTYTSSNTKVATILSGNIHIAGKGTAVITAKQAGNTNWSAAPALTRTLTVLTAAAPAITAQPSNLSVTADQNAMFTVFASGMPLPGYQWQVSIDGGVVWNNLENTETYGGVSTVSLTVSNAMAVMSRYQFRCMASNRVGSDLSDPAMLRVASETLDFSGSDDFTTDLSWSVPTMSTSKAGALVSTGDILEYTVGAPSNEDAVIREWTPNVGSYIHDWTVQVDVHLDAMSLTSDQYANLGLAVVNADYAANPLWQTDHMSAAIDRYVSGGETAHNFRGNIVSYYSSAAQALEAANGSTDAALRISFNSVTKELTSWYDADGATGGYTWTLLQKVNIGSSAYVWDMTDSSTFAVLLLGGSGGVTLSSGQASFDNFRALSDLP